MYVYVCNTCVCVFVVQYMFAVLRDCVPAIRLCHHHNSPDQLLEVFEKEMEGYLEEKILHPLCLAIEEDLRLSTHFHLQLDDRNPFKVRVGVAGQGGLGLAQCSEEILLVEQCWAEIFFATFSVLCVFVNVVFRLVCMT